MTTLNSLQTISWHNWVISRASLVQEIHLVPPYQHKTPPTVHIRIQRCHGPYGMLGLGHLHSTYMEKLIQTTRSNNIITEKQTFDSTNVCSPCLQEKLHQTIFYKPAEWADAPRTLFHSDLAGPFSASKVISHFFTIYNNNYSEFTWLYTILSKNTAKIAWLLQSFLNFWNPNREFRPLECDNSSAEYTSTCIQAILTERGNSY